MSFSKSLHLPTYASYSPGLGSVQLLPSPRNNESSNKGFGTIFTSVMVCAFMVAATGFAIERSRSNLAIQPVESTPISQTVKSPTETQTTPTDNQAPSVVTTVAETQSDSSGLQAILDNWQKENSAAKFGVVVQELNNGKRTASLNPAQQFEAASLYKIYLADYIYSLNSQGKLSFNTTLSGMPNTVGNCLKSMIVVSDNMCGESLGYALGWPSLNNFVHNQGFNKTTMSPVNSVAASDLAKYLTKLQDGSLLANSDYQNQLLGYMKNQIYRSGIPAGVPGTTVADKVGSNPGLYHDAAIVYGPKSTYVLVVLSTNSSSAAIKNLSSQVAAYFNRN